MDQDVSGDRPGNVIFFPSPDEERQRPEPAVDKPKKPRKPRKLDFGERAGKLVDSLPLVSSKEPARTLSPTEAKSYRDDLLAFFRSLCYIGDELQKAFFIGHKDYDTWQRLDDDELLVFVDRWLAAGQRRGKAAKRVRTAANVQNRIILPMMILAAPLRETYANYKEAGGISVK
jgi:hypothetical protein